MNEFTRIPNNLIDNLKLNPYQFQVLSIIIRKTDGWCKVEDGISLSQFIDLVTFSKNKIISTIKELENLNLIEKSKNYDEVKKIYSYSTYKISSRVVHEVNKGSAPDEQGVVHEVNKQKKLNTKETNTNIKNKQKEKSTPKKSLDISAIENHILKDEVLEFIEHRKDIKKPFTQLAFKKFINLVDNFISQNLDVVDMMNKSITAGYPTIYQPKANIVSNNQNKRPVYESMEDKNARLINEAFDMANNIENGKNDIIDTEIL